LPLHAAREQLLAARLEFAVKLGDEAQGFGREDLRELFADRPRDGDALREGPGHVHRSILLTEMWHCNMKSWTEGSSLDFQVTPRNFTS
jgi:hypothetical protein